jgi:hypothetical protein
VYHFPPRGKLVPTIGFLEGSKKLVKINKVIQKRLRRRGDGVNIIGDVNATVAGNIGEGGTSRSRIASRQSIVQRSSKNTGRSKQSFSVEAERDVE